MITISLMIGFFGLMLSLVAAVFSGIVVVAGTIFAASIGILTKAIEKCQSQDG